MRDSPPQCSVRTFAVDTKMRGCLKMIFDNHERQLPFLREAVEKLSNYFKKQRTYPEGQGLPLKKCAVYTFGNAMQQSGQPDAFPTGLFVFYDAASEGYNRVDAGSAVILTIQRFHHIVELVPANCCVNFCSRCSAGTRLSVPTIS